MLIFLMLVAAWSALDRSGWFGFTLVLPFFIPVALRELKPESSSDLQRSSSAALRSGARH